MPLDDIISVMNRILSRIYPNDVYEGFTPLPESLTGWGGNALIFSQLVDVIRPRVIVEVGSWKGQSAVTMAEACQRHRLDCAIICVDTWLGSEEHILNFGKDLRPQHGFPTIYYQFLSNVVHRGVQEIIVPFPTTSLSAAAVLKSLGIKADLIYIDANHQFDAVLADLKAFVPLLAGNGIMFGHDHRWDSVREALQEHCNRTRCGYRTEGDFWILNSPQTA